MEPTLGDFLELVWGNGSGMISIMAQVLIVLVQGNNFQFFTRLIFRILSELAGVLRVRFFSMPPQYYFIMKVYMLCGLRLYLD